MGTNVKNITMTGCHATMQAAKPSSARKMQDRAPSVKVRTLAWPAREEIQDLDFDACGPVLAFLLRPGTAKRCTQSLLKKMINATTASTSMAI
mmetsp:Transcript_111385/g.174100  ORF Transcript_111385/g.174100 Transcript_111385/m.174100 type:complete len:93 (-) Transcript_111385:102-380(-)